MRKIIMTALAAVCVLATVNAQEEEAANPVLDRKHELRLDALDLLGFTTLEFNYEYVLSKYSGVGASLSVGLGDNDESFSGQKFALTPFYRQYFLNKKEYGARGMFVEGMMQLAGGEDNYYYNDDPSIDGPENEDWFNVGAGLAVGQKWVSHSGFVFEISAGGGRYFSGGDNQPEGFFRGGVLVGYRF